MKILIYFLVFLILKHFLLIKFDKRAEKYFNDRIKNNKTTPTVYDIAHKFLPNYYEYEYLHNYLIFILSIPLIIYPKLLYEYLSYFIVILFIRIFMISWTVLPKYKKCSIDNTTGINGGCYDKIFSGHFSSILLITLLYLKYDMISFDTLMIINIINALIILSLRSHYTIDVIVAFFVTMFVYQNDLRLKI